jgi:hypothetical protein
MGCVLGLGSGNFTCQGDEYDLLPQLEEAIDRVVAEKPHLFDLTSPVGVGGYLILDQPGFYEAVIESLGAAGLCGTLELSGERISVKSRNSFSEDYDIVTSQSRIWRGPNTYVRTCTPANFPLTPEQAVAHVRVIIFGFNCPAGVFPPDVLMRQIPLGCRARITATPLNAVGEKLPLELHGPDIRWFVNEGEGTTISPTPDPQQPFNFILDAKDYGSFSLCATVADETGCLNGTVIPVP